VTSPAATTATAPASTAAAAGVRKRHLVVCRVGRDSLHRRWIGDPATRSYDVWLDAWDDDAPWRGDPARVSLHRNLPLCLGLSALAAERPEAFEYEAVFFPDDDIDMSAADVERLFAIRRELELDLLQPALREGSYFSHMITLENRSFELRFTNYVEVMCPLFSRAAFAACLPVMAEDETGWVSDSVWPRLLGVPRDRIAIVDAVAVGHTRPIGGSPQYARLGGEFHKRRRALAERWGVELRNQHRHAGGIPRGQALARESVVPVGPRFAWLLLRGAPRPRWFVRKYWTRMLRSLRAWRPP